MSKPFYRSKGNCHKRFIKEAAFVEHVSNCRGRRAEVVRVTSAVAAIDAAWGTVKQIHGTMPTLWPRSISTLPPMGFGRKPGRAAAQHFSEEDLDCARPSDGE
jgi:hypothetical protein